MTRYRNVTRNVIHLRTSIEDHTYLLWDSVTHVNNVTFVEPKRKIYTMGIIVSDAVTHFRNVTKYEIHFYAYLVWDSVRHA